MLQNFSSDSCEMFENDIIIQPRPSSFFEFEWHKMLLFQVAQTIGKETEEPEEAAE